MHPAACLTSSSPLFPLHSRSELDIKHPPSLLLLALRSQNLNVTRMSREKSPLGEVNIDTECLLGQGCSEQWTGKETEVWPPVADHTIIQLLDCRNRHHVMN